MKKLVASCLALLCSCSPVQRHVSKCTSTPWVTVDTVGAISALVAITPATMYIDDQRARGATALGLIWLSLAYLLAIETSVGTPRCQ